VHPTVDEQLRGVGRLLQIVAADADLSPESTEALAEASRILRRLEASWPHMAPFLESDNRATAAILGHLAPLLPARLAAAASRPDADTTPAHERNNVLRALLAEAIVALPSGQAGTRARADIAAHLRERIDRNPALGRVAGDR
jgi:hypothetical protein